MYQLSHLLIEQRNILATLKDESLNDQKNVIGNEGKIIATVALYGGESDFHISQLNQ